MRRTLLAALAAVLALGTLLVPAASADVPGLLLELTEGRDSSAVCESIAQTGTFQSLEVCIHDDLNHGRYGTARYTRAAGAGEAVNGAIWINRCQTGGRNCTQQAYTEASGVTSSNGYWFFSSDTTSASYGWLFHACATTYNYDVAASLYVCSPSMPGDPRDA